MSQQKKVSLMIGGCSAALVLLASIGSFTLTFLEAINPFSTSGTSSVRMTKAEFREQWAEKVSFRFTKVSKIFGLFGKPYKTQLIGDNGFWYWRCTDGDEMVLEQVGPSSVEIGSVDAKAVMSTALNEY